MKRIVTLAAGLIACAGLSFADPLLGTWQTAQDDNGNFGHIEVAPCGAALCGTLVRSFDANGAEMAGANIGMQIISETVAEGDGRYSGKVYSPDRDRTYSSRLQLTGDMLAVRGCVFGICRDGGTWQRVQ